MVFTPDGYRIYGHDFSVNEGSGLYGGFAEHLELLPGSMRVQAARRRRLSSSSPSSSR